MTTLIIILIILAYIAIGLLFAVLMTKKGLGMTYDDIVEIDFAPIIFALVTLWPLLAIGVLFWIIFVKLFNLVD